mgnify:CR=1 FL=1
MNLEPKKSPQLATPNEGNPYEATPFPLRDRAASVLGGILNRVLFEENIKYYRPTIDAPGPATLSYIPNIWETVSVAGQSRILSTQEEPFIIPAESIVSLPGAYSWQDSVNKNRPYIRRLARSTEQLKPVSGMARAFIQPNGIVFYELVNNGAHTAIAAVLRGLSGRPEPVRLYGELSVVHVENDIFK